MASGMQNRERVPLNLKQKLALATRSIEWSYAIFWSISDAQSGVLEWGDGYYNGDIKTRKTVQSREVNADQMDIQRSEQLRELFESLAAGEANPHARRPSTALSPEDLTDTEWYYLVCMSFVFNIGQGLPGRTLAEGQPIWLCNAPFADSKAFSRSLLAKSASIQTVVCFPFLGGVVELGVTEQVLEDPDIIQHIKTCYLDFPFGSNDFSSVAFHQDTFDTKLVPVIACEELGMTTSPNSSSNKFETKQVMADSYLVEEINGVASQVQSWQFMDDEMSNCVHDSMTSSDCISHTLVDPKEQSNTELTTLDPQNNELHYHGVLSALLKSSHHLLLGPNFRNGNKDSSFISWRKEGSIHCKRKRDGNPQRLLKKVLFEVPRMHFNDFVESLEGTDSSRTAKLTERYLVLKSIVPSVSKVDKVSILDNTIEYLKELERRVQELESCKQLTESEEIRKRKPHDTAERTSDNYGNDGKKPLSYKRKACDIEEPDPEHEVNVTMHDKDVVIDMKCRWKEGVLLEIMDAISNLHLDAHSVQSSTTDGILSLTIKSKFKGSKISSAGMIKQAIQRTVKLYDF